MEYLICPDSRIDGAVADSRRNRRSSHRSQQTALKGLRIRRIAPDQVRDAAGQNVAEKAEAAPQDGSRRDLPGDRRPGLQDLERGGIENISQPCMNRRVQG